VLQLDQGEFVEVEVGKKLVVDNPVGAFSFTAYDANHCPGKFWFRCLCSSYVLQLKQACVFFFDLTLYRNKSIPSSVQFMVVAPLPKSRC
jgi:hypothetical protein